MTLTDEQKHDLIKNENLLQFIIDNYYDEIQQTVLDQEGSNHEDMINDLD